MVAVIRTGVLTRASPAMEQYIEKTRYLGELTPYAPTKDFMRSPWDGRHAKQAVAVRRFATGLKLALISKERLTLHEEQRKGRQTNVRHAVFHLAAPLVRKGRTGRSHTVQKSFQHLHAGLDHT